MNPPGPGRRKRVVSTRRTQLADLRFDATFTTGQLFWLLFSNLLLIVFTLGLGYAWVVIRNMRFEANHLAVSGELDYATIQQAALRCRSIAASLARAVPPPGAAKRSPRP